MSKVIVRGVDRLCRLIIEEFGDAVDLLMDDIEEKTAAGGLRMLSIKKIRPFNDHLFHLYEGDCLEDMVASVREHGILNPVYP